ncbi:CPBP family intramembrane glutamic endopeptidase [Natrialbaceae archaeon A-arb3/5]
MVSDYRRDDGDGGSARLSDPAAAGIATLGLTVIALLAVSAVDHGLYAIVPVGTSQFTGALIDTIVFQAALLSVGLAYVWLDPPLDIEISRPSRDDRKIVVYGLTAALAVWFLAFAPTSEILPSFDLLPWYPAFGYDGSLFSGSTLVLFAALSLLVVAPVEEFFFRGVVQGRLRSAIPLAVAIGVASLVFAFFHVYAFVLPFLSPMPMSVHPAVVGHNLLYYTVMGVVFGVVYERTDTLVVPILVHGLFNAIYYLVTLGQL